MKNNNNTTAFDDKLAKVREYTKPFSLRLEPEDILPVPQEEREEIIQMRPSVSYWQDAMRRFSRNKVAMVSLAVIVLIVFFAFVGPYLSTYSYEQQIRGSEKLAPSLEHPFGTDALGRDMMIRVMLGTQISLLIGVFCAIIVLVIGAVYGAVSGYFGGTVDNVMMRIADIVYSLPTVLVIILLQIVLKDTLQNVFPNTRLGSSVVSIFIAFALVYWVNMARMVRGQVLLLKQNEYVTAAKAMGASSSRIIGRHLIPNSISTIIVSTLFQVPTAIFLEAFLSFLGLGPSAPMASLGSLANDALAGMRSYPYLLFYPALFICMLVLAFNQFGDGLRDALDPRLKK